MRAEESSKDRPVKKKGRRALKIILLCVIILIAAAVFSAPALVSSQWCRRIILTRVNSAVAGKVYFDELSMGWWKGISISGFSFRDNAGRELVEIKGIAASPRYSSILGGRLSFGEITIDGPMMEINLEKQQPLPEKADVQEQGGRKGIILPIEAGNIVVKDGSLKVRGTPAGPVEARGINTTLAVSFPAEGMEKGLANLAIRGESGIEEAQYMGFKFGPAKLNIQMQILLK